jgi:prevent-host-death family protein
MRTVELSQATGSLSEYVRKARRETLVLTRRGKAVAAVMPLVAAQVGPERVPALHPEGLPILCAGAAGGNSAVPSPLE